MNQYSCPFISIIIPVYNDAERLSLCLSALECQTYSSDQYEVIVVDNGSDEPLDELVSQFNQARLTQESRKGSYAARNHGLTLAHGPLIGFTDSDCIPSKKWLQEGVKYLLDTPKCGIVGGQINIFFKNSSHPTPVELYESITFLQQERHVINQKFSATANLFTFKEIFNRVGLFNADIKSGGDYEWCSRVIAASYDVAYAPEAVISHPARHSFHDLAKKVARVTGGLYDLKASRSYTWRKFLRDLAQDVTPPFRAAPSAWRDQRLEGYNQKLQVISVMFFVKYIRARERVKLRLGFASKRQ